jgi:hypothetical protein
MKSRIWMLVGVLGLLGLGYAYFFTEWVRTEPILIQAQVRDVAGRRGMEGPQRGGRDRGQRRGVEQDASRAFEGVYPVVFALDGEYRLTSVRVVENQPGKSGKAKKVLWHLVSASNSVPTKALMYGKIPRGMVAKDPRNPVGTLEAGTEYLLEVEAERYRGSAPFQTKSKVPGESGM